MARSHKHVAAAVAPPPASSTTWLLVAALAGLGFASWSTWVHYRILHDPFYSSVCDVNATFSCADAYTSRFGSIGGVPVALIGVLYFGFVVALIALCRRSETARQNLPGYVFAAATAGLAGVLYFAYASFFVLKTVCLLCLGSIRVGHCAVPALGCGNQVSHDESSRPRDPRPSHVDPDASRAHRSARVHRRGGVCRGVLPGRADLGVGGSGCRVASGRNGSARTSAGRAAAGGESVGPGSSCSS